MLLCSSFVFAIGFNQIALSLGLPSPPRNQSELCSQPLPVEYTRKCCIIPPVFSKKDFEICNLKDNFQKNATHGVPDCAKQVCVLKTLNFIVDGDKIDREAVHRYVDKWADDNPNYVSIIRIGKSKCLGRELPGPRELCEANKFVSCFAYAAIMACPKWIIEDENCRALKNRVDTCATYFPE